MRSIFAAPLWKSLVRVRRLSRRSYTYRTAAFLRQGWHERVTLPGRYALAAAVATGIAGSSPDAMAGSATFSAFLALVLLAALLATLRRPRVTLSYSIPPRCVAGSTIPLRVTLRNDAPRSLDDAAGCVFRLPEHLAIDGPIQYTASLPPAATHRFDYTLQAHRRGSYTLHGATALSAFPFGLMNAKHFTPDPHRLIVYPAFHPLVRLDLPVSERYQPGGVVLTSHVGESMEFIGNREYQFGDRVRDLHTRSWARVGYPVVKQYQEEFLTRVALIVDTHSPEPDPWKARPGETRRRRWNRWLRTAWGSETEPIDEVLEANLSLAASISDHLAREEHIVDLFAAGPELYHFQAGRSLGYLDNILDILACIRRCPDDPFALIAPRVESELSQVSTLIALFLDWDDHRRDFIERALAAGVKVKAIIVTENTDSTRIPGPTPGGSNQCFTPAQIQRGIDVI